MPDPEASLLALATATAGGGIALLRGDAVVAERTLPEAVPMSEALLPAIDALLAESFSFVRAYAQYGATLPSHSSLFSGLYPVRHGRYLRKQPALASLVGEFADAGYRTIAFTENTFVGSAYGFAEDFDSFDSTLQIFSPPELLEDVRNTLSETDASIVSSELSMIPTSTISLDNKTAMQTLRLLDMLEDLDDVQKVYSNADFPDEALDQYQGEQ